MGKRYLVVLIFILLHFVKADLYAQNKTRLPVMESWFGATSTNAAIGNTRLTVGISKYGELVNMRWPCSNYFDHLNYKTLVKIPFGWKVEDYNKHFNAGERQGSFAGIAFFQDGKEITSWLRNDDWLSVQSYHSEDAPIVVTTFTNEKLGLKVISTDIVEIDTDVLIRHFKVIKIKEKGLGKIQFVYLSNMAPCNNKRLFKPTDDWMDDNKNGFATVYNSNENIFLSFIPSKKDITKLPSKDINETGAVNYLNQLESIFPSENNKDPLTSIKDIYCAIGSDKKPISFCLMEDGTRPEQIIDFKKIKKQRVAYGPALCVSYYPINFENDIYEQNILFSFSRSYKKSIQQLNNSKLNFDVELNKSLNYWKAKLANANMPKVKTKQMQNTLKRTLINILITTHPDIGGIGSSVCANQPPYVMIWTRDAANMGFLLDCAGFTDEAERNALFFAKAQRKYDGQDCRLPKNGECYKGTWSQCYYADATPSWHYDMEIDEVGWGIWMFYTHALFLKGEKQKAYLEKVLPNIKMAANFLVKFKDKNGLQKKAREDDVLWRDQSLMGASTTLMGLKSAIAALKIVNDKDLDIKIYEDRQKELEMAIEKIFWHQKSHQFQRAIYGNFGPRGIIIWPAIYLPSSNQKIQDHADALSKQIQPFFNKTDSAKNKEWWYLGKATAAMAYAWKDDPVKRKSIEGLIEKLLTEVITQDTWVYGETPLVRDVYVKENGKEIIKRIYDNRVGQPCNIAAAYIYLTAEILYGNNASKLKY